MPVTRLDNSGCAYIALASSLGFGITAESFKQLVKFLEISTQPRASRRRFVPLPFDAATCLRVGVAVAACWLLALVAAPIASSETTIAPFSVSVSAKKYSKFGASGNLVKSIKIYGPGVRRGNPAVACSRKVCGRISNSRSRIKKVRKGSAVTFRGVNWLVAKDRGFRINLVPKSKKTIGLYADLAPPDALNKRFTIKAAGCISRRLKAVNCPVGTTLPTVTFKRELCSTPAFTRPLLRTPKPLTPAEQAWEGDLIDYGGDVYRMAGGAPIYVSSWSAIGGVQPTVGVSTSTFSAFRQYPADGTFIHSVGQGLSYVIAGGAPQYIGTWAIYGGSQPTVPVDSFTVVRAGHWSPPINRLRGTPEDGTIVRGSITGTNYVYAGGAPLAFTSWAAFGGERPAIAIDESVAMNPTPPWSDWSKQFPEDGTLISPGGSGTVYRVQGGQPHRVCQAFDQSKVVTVSAEAIDNIALGGVWNHLKLPVVE